MVGLFCIIGSRFSLLEIKNVVSIFLYVFLVICISPVVNKNKLGWLFIIFGLIFAVGIYAQAISVYFLKRNVRPIQILPLPTKAYYANRFLQYQDRPMGFFMEPAAYATYAIFPMIYAIQKKRYESIFIIYVSSVLTKSTLGFIVASFLLIVFIGRTVFAMKRHLWKIIISVCFLGSFVGIVVAGYHFGFFEKLLSTGSSTLNRVFSGYQVFWELPFFNKIFGVQTTSLNNYLTANSILIPQSQRVTMGFVNGYSYVLNYYGIVGFLLFIYFIYLLIKRCKGNSNSILVIAVWMIMMIGDSCIFNTHFCIFLISCFAFLDKKELIYTLSFVKKKTEPIEKIEQGSNKKSIEPKEKRKNYVFTGAVMIILSIILSVLSFAKELVFAHTFGSTGIASAYTLASELPLTIFAIFATTITSIVIPLFSKKYYKQGKKEADVFISNLMTIFGIISLFITALICIFADQIISLIASSWKNNSEYAGMHDTAVIILRFASILIICNSIIDTTTGILNFYHKFVTPRFLTGLRNLVFILCLISLHNMFGIYAALIGLIGGIVLETIIFFIIFCKHVKYKPDFKKKDGMLKEAMKIAIPILIGSGADELTGLTDKMVASSLAPSSISNLSYAYKPTSIITNVIVGSIHTIAFPIMAKHTETSNKEGMKNSLRSSFIISMILAIPLAIGGSIISKDIVYLIYGRGSLASDFSSLNTISFLFGIYLILSFFAVARSLYIKAFYSNKNTIIPVIFVSGGLILNTGLNCLFVFAFKLGVEYLSLASLISTAISSIIIIIIFSVKYCNIFDKSFFISFSKILLAGVLMGAIVYFVYSIAEGNGGFTKVIFELLLGITSYSFFLIAFKEKFMLSIFNSIKNSFLLEKPLQSSRSNQTDFIAISI